MIVTKKYIQELRENLFINISAETEKQILGKFGNDIEADENGCMHQYTEQDVWEQIRKVLKI